MRTEANRTVGDRRSGRHAGEVLWVGVGRREVDHIPRFRDGYVDGKDGGVGHAVESEDVAIQIRDRNDEFGSHPERQPDHGACLVGPVNGLLDDAANFSFGKGGACRRPGKIPFRTPRPHHAERPDKRLPGLMPQPYRRAGWSVGQTAVERR